MKPQAILVAAVLSLVVGPDVCRAQDMRSDWHAFSMGYRGLEAGNTTLLSAVGQNLIGVTQHSNTRVASGFLADTSMSGVIVAVGGVEGDVPETFDLDQNYPNPFNPSTTIRFQIPEAARVTLKVYNVLGQEITTLVDEERAAGTYDVLFDASALPSGAYFYRLQAGYPSFEIGRKGQLNEFIQTRKFLLLR